MTHPLVASVQNMLVQLLNALSFPYTNVFVEEEEGGILRANIETDRVPFLIGTHGDRIDALQHVLKKLIWKQSQEESFFLVVDVDHYRKNQEEKMLRLAEEKIEALQLSGISQIMPPLDPYLRKLIHLFVAKKFPLITTESVDADGRRKRIVLSALSPL